MLALLRPLRRGDGDFERFGRYAEAMLDVPTKVTIYPSSWIIRICASTVTVPAVRGQMAAHSHGGS